MQLASAARVLASTAWAAASAVTTGAALAPRVTARHMSIHTMTRLAVADNSGAKEIMCIGHVRNRNPAKLGDVVRAVVKSAKHDAKVSKKEIVAAVVVRQRSRQMRPDGSTVRFQENAAVLLKRDMSAPIGTRVLGPVARELRGGKFSKVVSMASRTV